MRYFSPLLFGALTGGMLACSSDPDAAATTRSPKPQLPPFAEAPAEALVAETAVTTPVMTRAGSSTRACRRASPNRSSSLAPEPGSKTDSSVKRNTIYALADVRRIYRRFEKQPQAFRIASDQDTVLVCPEGTRVAVPAEAFVDARTGRPVTGPVEIRVREYLSLADIVLNDLSTRSGSQLLETGGMLHIEAVAGGRTLALRKGKELTLGLPESGMLRDGMQAFAGVRGANGRLDWRPLFTDRRRNSRLRVPRMLKNRLMLPAIGEEEAFDKPTARLVWKRNRSLENRQRLRKLSALYDKGLVDAVEVEFDIDSLGNVADAQILQGADAACCAAVLEAVTAQAWKPATCWASPIAFHGLRALVLFARNGKVYSQISYLAGTDACPDNGRYARLMQQRLAAGNYGTLAPEEVSSYLLSATQLGWINCDRFLNSPEPKVNMLVEAPGADVKLVFRQTRSILGGYSSNPAQTQFDNLPQGQPVTIVALRFADGVAQLATKQTTIGAGIERGLVFRKVTPAVLREEIARLEM